MISFRIQDFDELNTQVIFNSTKPLESQKTKISKLIRFLFNEESVKGQAKIKSLPKDMTVFLSNFGVVMNNLVN